MDSNPWSLLHIVFPLYLCGLRKNIIYVYLEEGRPFYFVFLCRSRVCRYIFGRLRFLYFVVSSTSWNYELQWKMYMWIDISCECWHEFHGISSNISYIVWTLKWISLEFRMIAGMNFPGEFRRNFFSLLYVGWALTWISLELSYTWLLLERLYEFTGKSSTRMACSLSFEHLNCWIFIHATSTVCMNSINIMTDELDYCTACCVSASMTGVDFYMYRMWCLSSSMEWDVFILRLMCQHWLCVISYITVISYSPWNDARSVLYFYFCIIYVDNVTR